MLLKDNIVRGDFMNIWLFNCLRIVNEYSMHKDM